MDDSSDKKILEYQLSATICKAVSKWLKQNEVDSPVSVVASVSHPSCYVDEVGVVHTGPLVVCHIDIEDDEDDDDDY